MQPQELKTSPKQRIFIGLIAVVMLLSSIAVYALIVMGGGSSSTDEPASPEVTALQNEISTVYNEYNSLASSGSSDYLSRLSDYQSTYVKAYNSNSVNSAGLQTEDIVIGDGELVSDTGDNYLAYYTGWCSDESIFDTSLSSSAPLDPYFMANVEGYGLIQGWLSGVSGMRLGGARILSIPGELAYGESGTVCDGASSPLKFIIIAAPKSSGLNALTDKIADLYMQLYAAYYGTSVTASEESGSTETTDSAE